MEVSALIRIRQIAEGPTWRLVVEGTLSDGCVEVLETSWLDAQSHLNGTSLCIDLSGITYIDEKGRDLLARMIFGGAELRTAGIMTRAVVEEITNELKRNERIELQRGGTGRQSRGRAAMYRTDPDGGPDAKEKEK
jgi:anti-anti-sigma regulatory factor